MSDVALCILGLIASGFTLEMIAARAAWTTFGYKEGDGCHLVPDTSAVEQSFQMGNAG